MLIPKKLKQRQITDKHQYFYSQKQKNSKIKIKNGLLKIKIRKNNDFNFIQTRKIVKFMNIYIKF